MVVSKSWLVAVEKMRSIGAQLPRNRFLTHACFSRLAHHIGVVGGEDDEDSAASVIEARPERLALCSLRMRGLHTMYCKLGWHNNKTDLLLFPPSLTSLHLHTTQVDNDTTFETISQLPLLSSFCLYLDHAGNRYREKFNLSPFQRCPRLTAFMVYCDATTPSVFPGTAANIEQIRAMPHLTDLLGSSFLDREWMQLLRAPHQLRLERMTLYHRPTKELLDLMSVSVPELIHLDTPLAVGLSVLAATPHLRSLTLSAEYKYSEDIIVSPDQMIAGAGMCEKLHTLRVTAYYKPITSVHMQRILSCTPNLRELQMSDASQLDSLEFLSATKSLAHTLRSLRLEHCDFSGEQVRLHIYSLQQLAYFHLEGKCFSVLEDETRSHLRPPSPIFRQLQQSFVGEAK